MTGEGLIPPQPNFSSLFGSQRSSDVADESPLTTGNTTMTGTNNLLTHRAGDVLDKIVASLVKMLPSSE